MNRVWNIVKTIVIALGFAGLFVLIVATNKAKTEIVAKEVAVNFLNPEYSFIQKETVIGAVQHLIDTSGNTKLGELDTKTMENVVKKNKYVEHCKVYVNNSSKIQIDVLQKQPLLRVINNNGVSYYLDQSGVKFPVTTSFTANVPVVTGHVRYKEDSLGNPGPEVIHDLVTLCKFIEEDDNLSSLISQVVVNRSGDMELIPRTGTHTILIGKPNNLDDKFRRLLIFYKEGLSRVGWDMYSQVNLKYEGQVIAKKKEK